MDQSRRAVEAYWRSRMVDGVTSDEDKVAPVYKLEEICELLRTSPAGIVKEVSDYILKRLDHRSPIVKQKALRLIKYAVGKSGPEFRREMQRHSAAMRQLFHYKGQPDPLKGDALNKAVRDAAHDAIAAIFSPDEIKAAAPSGSMNTRIEGFGSTNFQMSAAEEKKSFISEVVELGAQSIKQGLSTIAAAHSMAKDDNGSISSYKRPTLRRSLTKEIDSQDRFRGYERPKESWSSSGYSKDTGSRSWNQDSRNEDAGSSNTRVKSREERLLETVVTSGGVRLQPTRDSLQAFLGEAAKLDAVAITHALETKLQSPLWQIRMKAMCVLESILRKNNEEPFASIVSYFSVNMDSIVKCSELPQVSLREKANKVLNSLNGKQISETSFRQEPSIEKPNSIPAVQMPDLIDTGDDEYVSEVSVQNQADKKIDSPKPQVSLVDDLFGGSLVDDRSTTEHRGEDDLFADVSFHVGDSKEDGDLFSGLSVDKTTPGLDIMEGLSSSKCDLLDVFNSDQDQLTHVTDTRKNDVNDLMAGLALNGLTHQKKQNGASHSAFSFGSNQPSQLPVIGAPNSMVGANFPFPLGLMQQNAPPNVMMGQVYGTHPTNYAAMGTLIAQQQLLSQNFGNMNAGFGHPGAVDGSHSSPLPDVFQMSNNPVQTQTTVSSLKKEESKAFNFISDHLSAARGSKR